MDNKRMRLPNPKRDLFLETNEQKMNDNRMSILGLNPDCQLEILKYIIADCKMRYNSKGNILKYADLVNFALAHENFEAIFKEHDKVLYKSLEFNFLANRESLEIDFSELQATHTGKEGDAFWEIFANAINENSVVSYVIIKYDPESYQPNFLDRLDKIKRALNNKKCLKFVIINFVGYSLEDLNNFDHITDLVLCVRMSAEALVEVCKSNPHLESLSFLSTEILGRLSDIAPHCRNLKKLEFAAKPDIDVVEYAPLAQLPNLKEMTIHGVSQNGSLLTIFEALTKWKRLCLKPLKITFNESLSDLRNFNIPRKNSILLLELNNYSGGISLLASYEFWDISKDSSPLEHSLATIPLIDATLIIEYEGLTLYECPKSDTDISGFVSILKLFNVKSLKLDLENDEIPKAKLFASIGSDKSYALKSINTGSTKIDQFVTSELVKINSITSLRCQFSDWESIELLSALTNLETVDVSVEKKFEKTSSKALCSLINTCSASGVIRNSNCHIEFRKIESITMPRKGMTALKILQKGDAISHIFEAFSCRDLITIEELNVLECVDINIKDILKMAEVHPIKKLRISLADNKDIEYLSDLAELVELTINKSVKGSLIKLFDQMAMNASPSLQCLQIYSKYLSSEELVRVSKIRSLKKLDLCYSVLEDCESLMELANSDIEELSLAAQEFSLQKLLSAIAVKSTTRLQHLKITENPHRYLEICELEEISKITSLKSLQCNCLNIDVRSLRNFKNLVKLDIDLNLVSNPEALQCFAEFEKLESLTLRWRTNSLLQNCNILADIQNLKELKLLVDKDVDVNLTNVYQALVSKNVKLTHLTTTIGCVEELNEITKMKTLRKLHVYIKSVHKKIKCLGELLELESLQITVMTSFFVNMDYVLPILKCCRNLDRLLINYLIFYLEYIHPHLKSIRDPTTKGPLTIIDTKDDLHDNPIDECTIPEILMLRLENAYIKVFTPKMEFYFKYI